MIVCLIRAGSVFIRCRIWKAFLTIRDGIKGNSIGFAYEKNKKKMEIYKLKFLKTWWICCFVHKITSFLDDGCSIKNDTIAYSNEERKLCIDKKLAKSGKFSAKDKGTTGIVRHNLNSIPGFVIPPISVSAVSDELCSSSVVSIPHTNIYNLHNDTKATQPLLESTFTNILKENSSMRPRIFVYKNSKWFIFKNVINP